MTLQTLLPVLLLLLNTSEIAVAQEREAVPPGSVLQQRKVDYSDLSNQIYSFEDPQSRQRHIINKDQVAEVTQSLHKILQEQIKLTLSAPSMSAPALKAAIEQVQGPTSLSAWGSKEVTNTPFVDLFEQNGERSLAVCYSILRGGAAIPDSLPFFEFYTFSTGSWQLKASTASDLTASGLFVQRTNSPLSGQTWYVVWGNRLGDTGARLNLRLYAFDGKTVRTISRRDDLIRGLVKVADRSISLEYDKEHNAPERERIHEILYITPNGLQ